MFICDNNCFNINPLIKQKLEILPSNFCYKCLDLKLLNKRYSLFSNKYFSIEEIKNKLKESRVINRKEFILLLNSLSIQLIDKVELRITNNYNKNNIQYEQYNNSFITENYKDFLNKSIESISRISTKEDDTHLVNYTGPVFNACKPCNFIKQISKPTYEPLNGSSNCLKIIINGLEKYFFTREQIINIKEIDEFLINNSIFSQMELLKELKENFKIEIFNIKSLDLTWIR
ncbi:hypothetical protein V6O07_04890 [Arthrospira platensis SPKY2]